MTNGFGSLCVHEEETPGCEATADREPIEEEYGHSTGPTRAASLFTQQALQERQEDTAGGSEVTQQHPFAILSE